MDNVEEVVRICPIIPTGFPNVEAMSTSSNPDVMLGGETANLAIASTGKMNLLSVISFEGETASPIFFSHDIFCKY
jgi:hypothetical protein